MDAEEGTKAIGGGGLALACVGFIGKQVPRLGLVQELAVSTLSRSLILQGLKRRVLYKRVLVDGELPAGTAPAR